MKQHVVKAFCLSLACVFIIVANPLFADEKAVNLESIVVQSFDDQDAEPWFVIGSKFSTAGFPKVAYVPSWPLAIFGSNREGKDLNSLGVAMLFDRREYNWVDLVPGTKTGEGEDATYAPVELDLPGRVRMIDMWVWSPNMNYYIEAYLRDFQGAVHAIYMGELNHIGWKNFRINVPGSIPQSKKYLPVRETLKLVKFRVWARPTEVAALPAPADAPLQDKAIFFYFDHLKVLTDTFEALYDGDTLTDPDFIQENWDLEANN
ncbi:MAG: flagellar filament outer layer protein FlaA [Spirochaetes bacterium]|nr:flagellar filament outer layer protein FlaA [Spirochaetota bacterium]MBU0953982.1 flagellar filament outer layer protein FlaA [Spirochaetota bacterium]